ncbi:unnamed protein product, partial [Brugia timori]|uniref:CASP-like protein n=1 Tax=Brugia timori TaxID=42155 RepID=A0A0R3QJ55_9BILA
QNYYGEGRGSHCSGTIKIPLQHTISTRKRANRTSLGGQWRRLLFAAGAALCAFLFAVLAVQTMRKAKRSTFFISLKHTKTCPIVLRS